MGKKHPSTNATLIPVVLSGGMGTRLWPMSRESYPKQFLSLSSQDYSLIQQTLQRVSDRTRFTAPIIVSNQAHRFLVEEKMQQVGQGDALVLLEPLPRNTAAAIAAAAYAIQQQPGGNHAAMLVLASDHFIGDDSAFSESVMKALAVAQQNHLVTFGIRPEYPETGFGYIRHGAAMGDGNAYKVEAFVEKPDLATAENYVRSGDYLWNSGMFLFPVNVFLDELKTYHPEIADAAQQAVATGRNENRCLYLEEKAFESMPSLSVDYALMERTKKAAVVPLSCGWSDIGSWDALWNLSEKDAQDNICKGRVHPLTTRNCYISTTNGTSVATLGVEDLVIVSTKDCVMIANRNNAQDVKQLVEFVRQRDAALVENHREVFRPWGRFDSIDRGERYQVKRITVKPGEKLSLQMHYHRSEHWIVVRGTAKVVCGDKESILGENESIYVPAGAMHRLENPGMIELEVIEVQSGAYLGEDDIVRFEDTYGRVGEPDDKDDV